MKRFLKILFLLLLLVVVGTYAWLRSNEFTRSLSIVADCPKLNAKDIEFPATVTISKLGSVTLEVDVSWVAANIPTIMRLGLPREGGSGGDRYSHSNFSFKVDDAGNAIAGAHVRLDNYGYFRDPIFGRQRDIHKGTIETDVAAKITPVFEEGSLDVSTSISIVKTRDAGFVKVWNDALPRIWFSLDRKLHEARKKADSQVGDPLLVFRDSVATEEFIADIVSQKLIVPESAKFVQRGEKFFLVAEYRLATGPFGYHRILKAYNTAKSKHPTKEKG